jgi:signal transduction histidine kinase
MSTKGSKFRVKQNSSHNKPAITPQQEQKNPTLQNNTAFYAVSRNASMKKLNLLIETSEKNRESLQKSEEKIRLFYHQLSSISQNTSAVIGIEFFNNLVQNLTSAFGMRYASISTLEDLSAKTLRTVAVWDGNKITANFTYDLEGTPCEKVMRQETCFFPQDVQTHYPNNPFLFDWDIHSCLSVPLLSADKQPFGVLSVMDDKPIPHYDHYHSILKIFAARCASELERIDIEARLKCKTQELEKSNLAMEDFVSIASHDLQEPLRKIVTFGSRLTGREHGLKPESKGYIERMQKTALRMQSLLEDLLLFSKTSTQTEPFKKVNLKTILKEVLTDLELLLEKNNGTLIFVGTLPIINGNPFQIRQLFHNLLSNAIKYHEEDKPPNIEINSFSNKQGGSVIFVKDQGIGFDEKHKDRVFRPFERLHGRNKFEGTGMGLAICKKIAENHDGSISVASHPGQGTCFSVTFPPNNDCESVQTDIKDLKKTLFFGPAR